ncbi:hypothetical protein AB0I53_22325, partial [Saccharopolyspora sp. NPDC050389]
MADGQIVTRDDGSVIAVGDGMGGSRADYNTWDWKHIKAAITGSAAVGKGNQVDTTNETSDPTTLWRAALSFRAAMEILGAVGTSVLDQARALAGEGRPWQGGAATAFLGLMEQFSKAFISHAQQIDGGPARINPVPEQLWAAGDYLNWARNTVNEIDHYYANATKEIVRRINEYYGQVVHADPVMDNGLVQVSMFPEVVEAMNRDMRQVLKTLAGQYQETVFDTALMSVPTPNALDDVPDGPGKSPLDFLKNAPPPPKFDPPKFDPPKFEPPEFEPPEFDQPKFDPSAFDPPAFDQPKFDPTKFDPGTVGPNDPGAFTPPTFDPTKFDPGTVGPNGPGAFTPPTFDPPAFEPPPGIPGNGPAIPPFVPPFSPPSLGSGSGIKPPSSQKPGIGSGVGMPELEKPGIEPFTPSAPPPMSEMPDAGDWAAGEGTQSIGTPDQRGIGMPGGMPMMPPMSPPAGAGGGQPERSDASGLL